MRLQASLGRAHVRNLKQAPRPNSQTSMQPAPVHLPPPPFAQSFPRCPQGDPVRQLRTSRRASRRALPSQVMSDVFTLHVITKACRFGETVVAVFMFRFFY